MTLLKILAVPLVTALMIGFVGTTSATPASAASAGQFDPGFIVSDEIFFNPSLSNVSDVDSLLHSKSASCAATADRPGCLKDFRTDTPTRAADAYCSQYSGGARETAATILVKVGQACGINPQALVVLLEKESGLVSRNNPTASSYRIAMGYGCPDTAACDTRYYGFFNQVYSAARQFRIYSVSTSFNYKAGRNNTIQWHPNAACGTSVVYIQNKATAGLYNYTPYRPNTAAMNNIYGAGDVCSSYGNRNFWRIFTDWFGSPTISRDTISFVKATYQDFLGRPADDGGIIGWGKAIANGMSTMQVSQGFAQSDEYGLRQIDAAYRSILGREPDQGGRQSWLGGLRAGSFSPDDIPRIFRHSDEYYSGAGQGTPEGFVAALYTGVLGRAANPDEVSGWSQVVVSSGRGVVVDAIWQSPEAAESRVVSLYRLFLDRTPDDSSRISWGQSALERGDGWVRNQIVGSVEYSVRAKLRYP